MITADVSPMVQVQALLASMIPIFDLSTPPVGNQLDIIGQWVGVSRYVNVPITGIFFSWDGTTQEGWDLGIWQDASNTNSISALPDDAYLALILARIAANHWDGTTEGAYTIFKQLFPNLIFLIQDNQNMTMNVIVIGDLDSLTLALLTGGYLPLRPEGVLISSYIVTPTAPIFGWDIENDNVQGWDEGIWGVESVPS